MQLGNRAIVPSGHRAIGRTGTSERAMVGCDNVSVCHIVRARFFEMQRRSPRVPLLPCSRIQRVLVRQFPHPRELRARRRFRPLLQERFQVSRRTRSATAHVAKLDNWLLLRSQNEETVSRRLVHRDAEAGNETALHCESRISWFAFGVLLGSPMHRTESTRCRQLFASGFRFAFPEWHDGTMARSPDGTIQCVSTAAFSRSFSVVCSYV